MNLLLVCTAHTDTIHPDTKTRILRSFETVHPLWLPCRESTMRDDRLLDVHTHIDHNYSCREANTSGRVHVMNVVCEPKQHDLRDTQDHHLVVVLDRADPIVPYVGVSRRALFQSYQFSD